MLQRACGTRTGQSKLELGTSLQKGERNPEGLPEGKCKRGTISQTKADMKLVDSRKSCRTKMPIGSKQPLGEGLLKGRSLRIEKAYRGQRYCSGYRRL